MALKKTHSPSCLDNDNKERLQENTNWAALNRGRHFSTQKTYLLSSNWSHHHDTLNIMVPHSGLNPIFQRGKRIVMDALLDSGQEGVKFKNVQFSLVIYLPESQTFACHWSFALDCSLNKNLSSDSLPPSLSPFIPPCPQSSDSPSNIQIFTFSWILLPQV